MTSDHALFLDRDGTIIEDCEGVLSLDKIKFEKHFFDFIKYVIKKKYKIVMVTNQTSVSKGLISFAKMKKTNDILVQKINTFVGQKVFDGIFICPYHPDASIKQYRFDSEDRKPKPGMFLKAKEKLSLNLEKSIMVGDRVSDIVAGNLAGCCTILKVNKFSNLKIIKSNLIYSRKMETPDYRVTNLLEIIPIMEEII